jgi:tetratricopeptide (TPR) repeat protein
MRAASRNIFVTFATLFVEAGVSYGQGCGMTGPGAQQARMGNLDEALASFQKEIAADPQASASNCGAGIVLDLMGRTADAKKYFERAIQTAANPQAKSNAQRSMALSYAFDGDCANTIKYEQMVLDYFVTIGDFYNQGEIADEAARVCIDAGKLDEAEKWYKTGHDLGLKQPDAPTDRKHLWEFRLEHALGRLAARRGKVAEAAMHVGAAKAILDSDPTLSQQQAPFFPYLSGYVDYYLGNYKGAIEELQKANQNDAFIQCLIGMTYEKLGEKDKATEFYTKASRVMGHNPPAAFARPFARKKLGLS